MRRFLIPAGLCCLLLGWIFLQLPLSKDAFLSYDGTSLKITDRYGILLRDVLTSEEGRKTWLSYGEIPANVRKAVIATEDKRFFSHCGVDVWALARAIAQNLRSGRVISGASTITQQLVKIRYAHPRTFPGKVQEMITAIRLEHTLSKEEILTHYLNRVSFSNQVVGIEAAARLYFGKPASHLSLAESVFLAGLIQAPSRYNPYRHYAQALQRQQQLLKQMRRRHELDETTYHIAQQETLRLVPKTENFKAPHFCDLVLRQLAEHQRTTGADILEARTTLDSYLQEQVEEIVTVRIEELKDYNVTNASVVVLDNSTGDVLAFVGSKDFFDDAISGQVNGALALRQPGSTLKPFTYQLALERSYTPATLLPDIKDFPSAPRSFLPENYDRQYHGPVRLREALACSYNIPAVRVLEAIGVDALHQRLQQFGIESLQELPSFYGTGLTLGNGEVTLLELTRAYSMLARGGRMLHERYLLDLVQRPEPLPTDPQPYNETPLFSPQVIYLLTHILADRQAAVAAFGESTPLELPFPTAVKTGTSKDYRDNWTIGFTGEYTVGVWVGNFDGTPMRKVSGISGAAPIYHDVMLALYHTYSPANFLEPPPEGIVTARICPLSGQLVTEDCPHGIDEVFLAGTEPTEFCQMHKAYWVDSRDGLLTTPGAAHAIRKVFIQFPPQYQAWGRNHGYSPPPEEYSPFAEKPITSSAAGESPHRQGSSPIRIVHPNHGDVYAIDPILRRAYQTLQFSAVVTTGISEITWYVDGEPRETVRAPFQTTWTITPGSHEIYAEGRQNGVLRRSDPIRVHIVD